MSEWVWLTHMIYVVTITQSFSSGRDSDRVAYQSSKSISQVSYDLCVYLLLQVHTAVVGNLCSYCHE